MLVAGFDCCSRSIACVVLDQDKKWVKSFFIESKKKTADDRLKELVIGLEEVNPWFTVAYIEAPIFIQNVTATNSIAEVIGVVRSWCNRNGVADFMVSVASWKKGVLGKGNVSKDDIMKYAKVNWGENVINQDIADAACIAMWGVLRNV